MTFINQKFICLCIPGYPGDVRIEVFPCINLGYASFQGSDRTDTEKELCRKEIEIDHLQEELQNAQSNVNKLLGQLEVVRSEKEEAEANGQVGGGEMCVVGAWV